MFKLQSFHKHIFITALIGALIITAMCVAIMKVTEPYAAASNGEKASEAWSVYAGDKEIAVVSTKKEARDVVNEIKSSYYEKGDKISNLKTDPALTYREKEIDDQIDVITVLDNTKTAVSNVLNANMSNPDNPVVTVSYTMDSRNTGPVKYRTVTKKTAKISKGEQLVLRKGSNGFGTVTVRTTYENGAPVKREVTDKDLTTPAVSRVVYKGVGTARYEIAAATNGSGIDTVTNMAYSVSPTTMTGAAAANFACQFIGNPYVYGGTSLTNGTDCSGFVMSVFSRFGISLPHSSGAQAHYGKSVPYSKARPGDVICYSGHVGIYIGNGKIVHAATPSQGIIVGSATYHNIKTVRRMLK